MNKIYLDYAATSPLAEEVNRAMYEFGKTDTGNPSSPHRFGQQAKIILEETRDLIAAELNCKPKEVLFTSGGTESNNLALIGTLKGIESGRKHIIISAVEHPSVIETVHYLEQIGYEISFLYPQSDGSLSTHNFRELIRPDTIFASIMYVNNETGIIFNIPEFAAICRNYSIHLHCDAVQAFGKIPIDFSQTHVDLLSISAHKIHGPKGIGALIVKEGVLLENMHFGGGQEANRRPGTENLTGIVGFAGAVKLIEHKKNKKRDIEKLHKYFESHIKSVISPAVIIGENVNRSPYISTIAFPGVDNENMLLNLDLAGIAVSVGSACSSGSINQSHVLKAMSLPDEIINSTLRFSYGKYTIQDELDQTIDTIRQIYKRLN